MSKMTLPRDKHGIADFGDRHWQDFGECLDYDPELMFPSDKKPEQVEEAKRVCRSCPFEVSEKCLMENLTTAYGVFGGMTPEERRAFAGKQRRRTPHLIVRNAA